MPLLSYNSDNSLVQFSSCCWREIGGKNEQTLIRKVLHVLRSFKVLKKKEKYTGLNFQLLSVLFLFLVGEVGG